MKSKIISKVTLFSFVIILFSMQIFPYEFQKFLPPLDEIPFFSKIPRAWNLENRVSKGSRKQVKIVSRVALVTGQIVNFNTHFRYPLNKSYLKWKDAPWSDFETDSERKKRLSDLKNKYVNLVFKTEHTKYFIFFRLKFNFNREKLRFRSKSNLFTNVGQVVTTFVRRETCEYFPYPLQTDIPYSMRKDYFPAKENSKFKYFKYNNGELVYDGDDILDCREFHERHEQFIVCALEFELCRNCRYGGELIEIDDYRERGFPFIPRFNKLILINYNLKKILATWDTFFHSSGFLK